MAFGVAIVARNRFEDAPCVRATAEQARFEEPARFGKEPEDAKNALLLSDLTGFEESLHELGLPMVRRGEGPCNQRRTDPVSERPVRANGFRELGDLRWRLRAARA